MVDADDAGLAQASEVADYEQLPYQSMPFDVTQPSHMAGIARLFGLEPPPAESARILELGCASGGNIIPLAARFPEASFTGIDLSSRHVEEAQASIARLGLANIRVEKADIAAFVAPEQGFDYIICHGVYSWVPPAARDAIFKICARGLAGNGLAYISYNVFPGWHLRRVVRDMCLYHAGNEGSPNERVGRFRWLLSKLATLSDESKFFGQLLRHEAGETAKYGDSYILGEFLAPQNEPCYFHEFIDQASSHDLGFLSEAELSLSVPELLGPDRSAFIREVAGESGLAIEQYMDFITGRTFRRSVLARTDALATRRVTREPIRGLYLSSRLVPKNDPLDAADMTFEHGEARITTDNPAIKEAFLHLARIFPANCSYAELADLAAERSGLPRAQIERDLLQAVFRTSLAGQVRLSSVAQPVGRATDARPQLWPVARAQAEAGQSWLTSLTHEVVSTHPAMRWLMMKLDGLNGRAELEERMAEGIRSGEVVVKDVDPQLDDDRVRFAARVFLARLLSEFERKALLRPSANEAASRHGRSSPAFPTSTQTPR